MTTHPIAWAATAAITAIACAGLWWLAAHQAKRYTAPADVSTTVPDITVPDSPAALDHDDACPGCGGHHDIAEDDPHAVATAAFLTHEITSILATMSEHAADITVPAAVIVVVPTGDGAVTQVMIDPESFPDVARLSTGLHRVADRMAAEQGEINFQTASMRDRNGGAR